MIEELKKTMASKLWFSMVVMSVVLLNVSFVEAKSLKKGEEFKDVKYPGEVIRVVSSDEVEIEQGPEILLGKYTIDGERVRIVANILGATTVRYFKIIPDGLVEEKTEIIYYSKAGLTALEDKAKNWDAELYNAVLEGNPSTVKTLIKKGADVNVKDNNGNAVLIFAVEKKNTAIIKMLLDKGADVNAVEGKVGFTALITAGDLGKTEIVKMLLEKGADVNIKTSSGKTVFDYTKDPKILEMLNKYAAQKKK